MTLQQTLQLALQHQQAGRRAEAESLYRQALAAEPASHMTMFMLGALLMEQRQSAKAVDLLSKAIALSADVPEYHNAMGNALANTHQFVAAARSFAKATQLRPTYADAHYGLGRALIQLGEIEQAIAALNRAVTLKPGFAAGHAELANALRRGGQLDEALAAASRAVQFDQRFAWGQNILGLVHYDRGEYELASVRYARAISLRPELADPYINRAQLHRISFHLNAAAADLKKAISLRPEDATPWNNLGVVLAESGAATESIQCFRNALKLRPTFAEAHSGLLMSLNYQSDYSPHQRFDEHLIWARQHASPFADVPKPPRSAPPPDGRLRIGYVSADFFKHPVASFIEPILANHDAQKFEVFCYADILRPDAVTTRLKSLVPNWRDIRGLSHDAVAEMISRDGVDVLIDLGGHTERSRLLVFARRPAGVQITYLGYPNTTGLPMMDYRLTDAHADPPGESDALHTEKLLRLPSGFLCFLPLPDSPKVSPLPANRRGGVITFTSFNNLAKLTPSTIAHWARILEAVPGSHLMLKNRSLADPRVTASVAAAFAKNGIERGRLDLRPPIATAAEHLRAYSDADIALDTYPYNGTTTTCEALWMGVPVITWAGDCHAARVGASILHQIDLPNLIGNSEEHYLEIAVSLAADLKRLQELRQTMRDRMTASPLLDGKKITRDIEAAYTTAVSAPSNSSDKN